MTWDLERIRPTGAEVTYSAGGNLVDKVCTQYDSRVFETQRSKGELRLALKFEILSQGAHIAGPDHCGIVMLPLSTEMCPVAATR